MRMPGDLCHSPPPLAPSDKCRGPHLKGRGPPFPGCSRTPGPSGQTPGPRGLHSSDQPQAQERWGPLPASLRSRPGTQNSRPQSPPQIEELFRDTQGQKHHRDKAPGKCLHSERKLRHLPSELH